MTASAGANQSFTIIVPSPAPGEVRSAALSGFYNKLATVASATIATGNTLQTPATGLYLGQPYFNTDLGEKGTWNGTEFVYPANNAALVASEALTEANVALATAESATSAAANASASANLAANTTAVYAQTTLVIANASLNFNNTATTNTVVYAETGSATANIEVSVNTSAVNVTAAYNQANAAYAAANNAANAGVGIEVSSNNGIYQFTLALGTGSQSNVITAAGVYANPSTNNVTANAFIGYLIGSVTGSVTGTSSNVTITNQGGVNATYDVAFCTSTNGLGYSSTFTYNPVTHTLVTTSDINQKTNVRRIEDPLDVIRSIHGVRFNWKESGAAGVGVIAQNVQKHLPELVVENNDGYLAVSYDGLVAPLIEAVKALTLRIEELEARANA